MRFGWVRYVAQTGAWGDQAVELELQSSRLAAPGYLTVLALAVAMLASPLAAIAGVTSQAGIDELTIGAVAASKLLILGGLTIAALAWLAHCCFRSTLGGATVRVEGDTITVVRRGPTGAKTTRQPVSEFEGLAVLPLTTLGGRLAQLYLVHPDRSQSILLATDLVIPRDIIREIAQSLGVAIIGEAKQTTTVARPTTEAPTALAA